MKIGLVDDGQAESQALRHVVSKLSTAETQLLAPIYADMQPKATPGQIARAAVSKLLLLAARNVDQTIVLIDLEDREDCAGFFSEEVKKAFGRLGYENVSVVIKHRTFENWLIADLQALENMSGRFKLTRAARRQIEPDNADRVGNAGEFLDKISLGKRRYHKRTDAIAIAKKQGPLRIGANSRSFRRLLRVLGHPSYADQSLRPAAP